MTARLTARVLSYLDYIGGGVKKSQESHLSLVRRSPVLSDKLCRAAFPSIFLSCF